MWQGSPELNLSVLIGSGYSRKPVNSKFATKTVKKLVNTSPTDRLQCCTTKKNKIIHKENIIMIWKPLKQETAKAWKLFTILLKTELIKAKRI